MGMRHSRRLLLALVAALAAGACDEDLTPTVASLSDGTSGTTRLAISPNQATMNLGAILQLSTNAPLSQRTLIQWASSNTTVTTISPDGLVHAVGLGTSTILARYSSDSANVATATIIVVSPTGTTGNGTPTP